VIASGANSPGVFPLCGFFCLFIEDGEWVRKDYLDCLGKGFNLPKIFLEMYPKGWTLPH
jgi:hypothetical protein